MGCPGKPGAVVGFSRIHRHGQTTDRRAARTEPNVTQNICAADGTDDRPGKFLRRRRFARHPKLRVAFLEANCSWLPWLLWRLDEGWEREGDVWAPDLTIAPSQYFKRHCVVSVEPDEITATHVIDAIGSGQIVFSTDYPARRFEVSRGCRSFSQIADYRRRQEKYLVGQLRLILRHAVNPASIE